MSEIDKSAAGVPEGTEVDYKAAYEALRATFTEYRVNTIRVATKYGSQAGGCSVVDKAIREIDPVMKRARFGASATVTIKISVGRMDSREPVTDELLWALVADAGYEFGRGLGKVNWLGGEHRVEIVEPFTRCDADTEAEVPEYVAPGDFEQHQLNARREAWAAGQASGRYGTCQQCDGNLTHHYECSDEDCDEYVPRREDGSRIYS